MSIPPPSDRKPKGEDRSAFLYPLPLTDEMLWNWISSTQGDISSFLVDRFVNCAICIFSQLVADNIAIKCVKKATSMESKCSIHVDFSITGKYGGESRSEISPWCGVIGNWVLDWI